MNVDRANEAGVEELITNWVYELLVQRRYRVIIDYLQPIRWDRFANVLAAEIMRVNRWIAMKRNGRLEECRTEIENWQVVHLKDQFNLAKLVLLGDIEEAAALSDHLLQTGGLRLSHWAEWPLLEEVREHQSRQAEQGAESPEAP